MSDKAKFQEILTVIRTDLKYLLDLWYLLQFRLIHEEPYRGAYGKRISGIREWIFDVFLDKAYEIDAKVKKVMTDFGRPKEDIDPKLSMRHVKDIVQEIALHEIGVIDRYSDRNLQRLYNTIRDYEDAFEKEMTEIRERMYDENWSRMKQIRFEDYILPIKRARYVSARDELEKAKDAVKEGNCEEVLNHLRPAIDLALKEKFGFKRIKRYGQFFDDARKYHLPLPSFRTIYYYFDEGSQRLHKGKVHTPLECENALNFVVGFIDRLDLIDISQKEIEEFRKKSNAVE